MSTPTSTWRCDWITPTGHQTQIHDTQTAAEQHETQLRATGITQVVSWCDHSPYETPMTDEEVA